MSQILPRKINKRDIDLLDFCYCLILEKQKSDSVAALAQPVVRMLSTQSFFGVPEFNSPSAHNVLPTFCLLFFDLVKTCEMFSYEFRNYYDVSPS